MLRIAPELVLCIWAVVRTVAGSSPGVRTSWSCHVVIKNGKRTFLSFIPLCAEFCLFFHKLLAMQIKKGSLISHKSALLCTWITSGAFIMWLCSSGKNDKVARQVIYCGGEIPSRWEQIPSCQIRFWVELWSVVCNTWTGFLYLDHFGSGLNFFCCRKVCVLSKEETIQWGRKATG